MLALKPQDFGASGMGTARQEARAFCISAHRPLPIPPASPQPQCPSPSLIAPMQSTGLSSNQCCDARRDREASPVQGSTCQHLSSQAIDILPSIFGKSSANKMLQAIKSLPLLCFRSQLNKSTTQASRGNRRTLPSHLIPLCIINRFQVVPRFPGAGRRRGLRLWRRLSFPFRIQQRKSLISQSAGEKSSKLKLSSSLHRSR